MLEKLLDEVRQGGTLQPAVLAARLNISVGLVEMMLEDLERHGRLTQVNTTCDESCGGCPLAGGCATNHASGRMWVLVPGKTA